MEGKSKSNLVRDILFTVGLLLAMLAVAELATLIYLDKRADSAPPPNLSSRSSFTVAESSDFIHLMEADLAEQQDAESREVNEYATELAKTEEGRREQERLRLEAEQKLRQDYLDMLKAQAELQEQLDQKAEQEILASGGHSATRSDHVYIGSPGDGGQEIVSPENSAVPETEPSEPPTDPSYLGQFSAKIVCTCASCFNAEEHPSASVGEQCVLADPNYIATGKTIKLDQGISGDFQVRDGTGQVEGRAIIVYSPNHSETQGGQSLYPKIYESEE